MMNKFLTPLLKMGLGAALITAAPSLFAADSSKSAPVEALSNLQLDTVATVKTKEVYIVRLRSESLMEYSGGISGMAATKPNDGEKINPSDESVIAYSGHLDNLHEQMLQHVGSSMTDKVYTYRYAANGFAAKLTLDQAEELRQHYEVLGVYKDQIMQVQTNNTPTFLGLTSKGSAWLNGLTGENVVVGVLDTGINPEHPSFADTPTPANGSEGDLIPYGDIPASFTGSGCEFGNDEFNENDAAFTCNNKLIKAQYFVDGWGINNVAASEFLSARDSDGHGSHTASTAAGNYGVNAEIDGEPEGMISGIAPRARVAAYKVCWQSDVDGPDPDTTPDAGCASSDSMAAIDQAVADGVDVINFSIGGPSTSFNGPSEMSFLLAADAGVWVATSQGNSGPGPETTGTPAGVPWITAVGASQDDQVFATGLTVSAPTTIADTYVALEGSGAISLEDSGSIAEDVVPVLPADGCAEITNTEAVTGKIALVIRGGCGFLAKYQNAAQAGATAIVVYNDGTASDRINPIVMGGFDGTETIPGVMIGFDGGNAIALAHAADDIVSGELSPEIAVPQVDRIANFSSRGANAGARDIIKPDITAPGVNILAAGTDMPNIHETSAQFQFLSGTSMSSPHVAGLFALLKQANPDWTPAMARSALMTTARQNLRKTFGDVAADPFDIGAGFIQPDLIFEPGLVYDAGLEDYLAFTCENNVALIPIETCAALEFAGFDKDASNLNLPSIAVAELTGFQIIRRTVTSVEFGTNTFDVTYNAPEGIEMFVWPSSITLEKGESATYQVLFKVTEDSIFDEWSFGSLQWNYDGGIVRSPIAIRPVLAGIPESLEGEGTTGSASFDVLFGFDGDFNVTLDGMVESIPSINEIEDGAVNQTDVFVIPEGVSLARFAMFNSEVGSGAGTDDLDLQIFGPDTMGFPNQGVSQGGSSEETVDIVNPEPGVYIAVVVDFASEEGPTPYTVHNFNLDGTNTGVVSLSAPTAATGGGAGNINMTWFDLNPASRYFGIISYDDGFKPLATQTEVMINTQ